MVISFVWLALGILGLFGFGSLAKKKTAHSKNPQLSYQLIYQPLSLCLALLLWFVNRLTSETKANYLTLGNLTAGSSMLDWLGFDKNSSWMEIGTTFAIIPLIVTSIVVYFQVLKKKEWSFGKLGLALLVAIPLSITNALTEELIFRLIPLEGISLSPMVLAIISAFAFGVPHYFGTPGKFIGVAMATFLGYVAACSVLETQSIGWAWLINFVQDVPIIAMLLI